VHDDDFNVPEIVTENVEVNVNFSIAKVKEFYRGFDPTLIQAGPNADTPLYVEGYVVSSDESGNFFRTLIIQDKSENPTSAIAISTDATDVYTLFEPGRKVFVRVDGLYSGEYARLPSIGLQGAGGSGEVGRISTGEFDERVVRTNIIENLVPLPIALDEVAEEYLNMLVQFNNVQIPEKDLGNSYANLINTYGVDQILENCAGDQVILRTSGFADFKNLEIPAGNGSIITVLGRFNANFQVYIRDISDVEMNGERCE
jgi:hypothetical protein